MNKGWEPIPRLTGPHVLVSDAERSIRSSLADNPDDIQLDLVHAVKEALFIQTLGRRHVKTGAE
ncbi:MAG: hypothetical protein HYY22_04250 [Thaumarchaeota archaeon]|nr:hypothetical protein [Nitrososphaerota archaeon]